MKLHELRGIVADYSKEYPSISSVMTKCLRCVLSSDEVVENKSLDDFCLLVSLKEPLEGLPDTYRGLPVFYEVSHEMTFKE